MNQNLFKELASLVPAQLDGNGCRTGLHGDANREGCQQDTQ